MSKLAELQEKRNKLAGEIRQLGDRFNEKKAWPDAETEQNYTQANTDYDAVLAEMETIKTADGVADRLKQINDLQNSSANHPISGNIPGRDDGTPGNLGGRSIGGDSAPVCTEQHRALALAGWMRNQVGGEVTEEMQSAAKLAKYRLGSKSLEFGSMGGQQINQLAASYRATHPAMRAMRHSEFLNAPLTTGTGSTGGHIIAPETLMRNLEINMLAFDGMAQVADLMVTASGEPLSWPTVDDTGNSAVQIGESANLDNSNAGGPLPTFGKQTWNAYKISSQAILVPYELLEDNVFDLPAILGQMMGERIGRFRNDRYTNGTGSSQASGLLTDATLGVTAASATAIAADEVIDLQHSVDPAYRTGAGYMAHDSVILYLRKLKDSEGRYLWQNGFNTGTPDTLNASPLTINQAMPSAVTTGNKTLVYGQLSKYKIRRVNGFRLYRMEERYRENDQDGFIMLLREDGGLLTTATPSVRFLQQA